MESVSEVEAAADKLATEAGLDEDQRFHIDDGRARGCHQRRAARQRIRPRHARSTCRLENTGKQSGHSRLPTRARDSIPIHLPDPLAPENLLRGTGRGIFLIRSLMDEVHFRQLHPGTELTLVKHLAPAGEKTVSMARGDRHSRGRPAVRSIVRLATGWTFSAQPAAAKML